MPKELLFDKHRYDDRFSRFEKKIVYQSLLGSPASKDEDPWKWEAHQRNVMTELLRSHLRLTKRPPIVIFSDVDEIPSAHTIRLLRGCEFAANGQGPLHLQMRTYLYSFEWPVGWGTWRAQVHQWDESSTYYRHSQASERALADAGWHCSYCFRRLEDFADKMRGAFARFLLLCVFLTSWAGFSHADRLNGDMSLMSPARIQKVICEGKDIFNMLPEVRFSLVLLQ